MDLDDWDVTWEGQDPRATDPRSRYRVPLTSTGLLSAAVRHPHPQPGHHIRPALQQGRDTTDEAAAGHLPGRPGGRAQGGRKRGVLHSLWARKRLAELEAEIATEMRANSESIGLEMAAQERDWIMEHFGIGDTPALRRARTR